MSRYLLTGCAGFIGVNVADLLLKENHRVVGIDNLNDAYDVSLKQWRLRQLEGRRGFQFHQLDITDKEALEPLFQEVEKNQRLGVGGPPVGSGLESCGTGRCPSVYGLDLTVVPYFAVYGPAGRPDMSLFRFVQWIDEGRAVGVYRDGSQERDFTYVEDIPRGTIAGIKPLGYEVINLGSDRLIAKSQYSTAYARAR